MWKKYIIAASIEDALKYLQQYKASSRIISGATDLMLEMESGARSGIDVLIDVSRIPCSRLITLDEDGMVHLCMNVTHNDCVGSKLIRENALPLALACWQVGSPQIRNRGTVAGNLVTASPANDSITPLMALGAQVVLRSVGAERVVPIKDFYTGVRKTVMREDEMVTEIRFPSMGKHEQGMFYKYALRNAQAISLVNVAVILRMADDVVEQATITMGAVSPTIIHAAKAEAFLSGKILTEDVVYEAAKLCAEEAKPISDLRSSAAYRKKMLEVITRRSLKAIKSNQHKSILPVEPVLLRKPGNQQINGFKETLNLDAGTAIPMTVNGKKVSYTPHNQKSLLRLLREDGLLTGTKEGCAEGECGACTVIMDGMAVMSCMVPAQRAFGTEVKTVEGLAENNKLHPIQTAFIETGAVQCGYCTPGFLVSAAMLMEEKARPGGDDVKQAITGNLCRCTGYYSILQAIEKAVTGE